MASVLDGDVDDLQCEAIIGFDGTTINGLRMHPDGIHIIYPLGNKIIILNWNTMKQEFLAGHTNIISAIDVSMTGKYVASGQINHIGFRALVIIWNYSARQILITHEVHKVRVEAVRFTRGEKYMISLGGRDCSSVVVWDLERGRPLCGAPASKGCQGEATTITVCHRREPCFITAGEGTLTVWKIDSVAFKMIGTDVNVSKLKRTVLCVAIDDKDEAMYCGTATGDVLKIRLNYHHDPDIMDSTSPPIMSGCYGRVPTKGGEKVDLFSGGVRAILILDKGILLIGAGDGTLNIVQEVESALTGPQSLKLPSTPQLKVLQAAYVRAMVTSILKFNKHTVLVATVACEIYTVCLKTFEIKLSLTCHTSSIYDISFPYKFSDVFATSSKNDVRIWNIETMQELLRIKVENFCCSGVVFSHDGKAIITGWNDGIIRSFTPLTGRLIYSILNAHNKGVSAITITLDDTMIISGGCEGQVRIWNVGPEHQDLVCTLKEHKGPVSAIHINKFNDEAVSASTDGTCIIWDIVRKCRKQILFANTLFMCVKYHPTAVQIVTGGSNRKISYWEVFDGSMIREMDGSRSAGLNALDISPDGSMFVTGGNDLLLKLWKYNEGITTHVGVGHSGVITAVAFSPNGKKIVSCSSSGSIFVWNSPFDVSDKQEEETSEAEQKKDSGEPEKKAKNVKNGNNEKDVKNVKQEKKKKSDDDEHVSELGSARQAELKKKCGCCPKKKK